MSSRCVKQKIPEEIIEGPPTPPATPNRPCVVWTACYMCLMCIFAVIWSLFIFFCVTDVLFITGANIVNAFLLLLGLIMFPTSVHMFCALICGRNIDHKGKVFCCPLWLWLLWITAISIVGAGVSAQRVHSCDQAVQEALHHSIKTYRTIPKYKKFVDNLQWCLKCCGLNSYKDWFTQDWYDKVRDYEWDPSMKIHKHSTNQVTDSVPLSCCKSGSCISNFLMELGTRSIHTKGCAAKLYSILKVFLTAHLLLFISVAMSSIIILMLLVRKEATTNECRKSERKTNVRHIMSVNDKFQGSSGSCLLNPEESDFEDPLRDFPDVVDLYRSSS